MNTEDAVQLSCSSLNNLSDCSGSSDSLNAIPSEPTITYDDLTIIKKLNQAKFPVFLSYSPSANQYFAMKVFPYANSKMNPFFINEARFAVLDHINVISIVHYESDREAMFEDEYRKVSYTIMELAPYGDFFDVIMTHKIRFDEKLARTYFHQLIEGLEYLHMNGVAHLDLKLENLLLGNNFLLKIADFDQAHVNNQGAVTTKGTVCYRPPELIISKCEDAEAADIYSAGIILFLFKTGGVLPHAESQKYKGVDLFHLMVNDRRKFWEKHCEIQGKETLFFDSDFTELFDAMVSFDPRGRPNLSQIKSSKWYNKETYSQEEVYMIMSKQF